MKSGHPEDHARRSFWPTLGRSEAPKGGGLTASSDEFDAGSEGSKSRRLAGTHPPAKVSARPSAGRGLHEPLDRGTTTNAVVDSHADLPTCMSPALRAYADHPVPAADRIHILHFIDLHGASFLIDVAQAIPAPRDGVATVLALCCAGVVELDVGEHLGPDTIVRRAGRRRRARLVLPPERHIGP